MRSGLSARVPECQKIKNSGLNEYGTERFGRLILSQSKNAGVKGLTVRQNNSNESRNRLNTML